MKTILIDYAKVSCELRDNHYLPLQYEGVIELSFVSSGDFSGMSKDEINEAICKKILELTIEL